MSLKSKYKIEKQQGTLFVKSTYSDLNDYKWLKDILITKPYNGLLQSEFEKLENKQKSFITDIFLNIYKLICDEWEDTGEADVREDWEKRLTCSLCGQKHTKYIKYLRNKKTSERINVGSSCIFKYNVVELDKKAENKKLKELHYERRKNLLNEKYAGIIGKIENLNNYLSKLPIFISKELEEKFNLLSKELLEEYNDYLKKGNPKNRDNVLELNFKMEELKKEIDNYIKEVSFNKFNQTRNIKEWCIKNDDKTAINFLKEDGHITYRCACRICESNLMEKILMQYEDVFNKSNLKVEKIDYSIANVNFYINKYPFITIKYSYKDFISEYGENLFNNNLDNLQIPYLEILKDSKIEDKNSLGKCSNGFRELLKSKKYYIKDYDILKNELAFENSEKDEILVVSLSKFINQFKINVFDYKLTEIKYKEIEKYIKSHIINTYTNYGYKEHINLEKEMIKKY